MKYIILTAVLLLGFVSSHAQSPADSARFCDPANWEIIRNENGILVKEYQSRRNQESTFLFAARPCAGSRRCRTKRNRPSAGRFALTKRWRGSTEAFSS